MINIVYEKNPSMKIHLNSHFGAVKFDGVHELFFKQSVSTPLTEF